MFINFGGGWKTRPWKVVKHHAKKAITKVCYGALEKRENPGLPEHSLYLSTLQRRGLMPTRPF